MIKIKKKGEWSKLQELILAAIFAVIIIGFLLPAISNVITTGSNTQACKTWVSLQSRAKVGGAVIKELKSPCISDRKELPTKVDEVYQTLAESMYDCWDMYGQGKIDFFSDFKSAFKDSNVYCFICSKVEAVDKTLIDVDSFGAYLNSHNPPNTQNTYAQFLLESETANINFGEEKSTLEINKDSPLYIMFHVTKQPDYSSGSTYKDAALKTLGTLLIGSQIPGASSLVSRGGALIKGGKFAGPIGFGIVAAGTFGAYLLTDAGKFYPSLVVVSGKDMVQAGCGTDRIHYNPKKNILESIGKKDINEFV